MKNFIRYILASLLCFIVFSCNNNFLKDESNFSANADEGIYLSPQWEAGDYSIHVPMAGNAKFSVAKTPDWLQVNTLSGQFNNDVATINCSASVRSDFSATGMYNGSMILDIEGKGTCLVPVYYISEGDPAIENESNIVLQYDYYGSGHTALTIRSVGPGILLWGIAEKPD